MQEVLSNTYIVWFKDCFETAEEAALALNGQTVFPLQHPQETIQDAVGRFLEQRVGYAKSLIQLVEPAAEYVRRENVFENTPCRSSNCYTAAVVIPPAARQPENAALPSGTADILYLLQDVEYAVGSLPTVLSHPQGRDDPLFLRSASCPIGVPTICASAEMLRKWPIWPPKPSAPTPNGRESGCLISTAFCRCPKPCRNLCRHARLTNSDGRN